MNWSRSYIIAAILSMGVSPIFAQNDNITLSQNKRHFAAQPGKSLRIGGFYTRFDGLSTEGFIIKDLSADIIPNWIWEESDSLMAVRVVVDFRTPPMMVNMLALQMARYKIAKRFTSHIDVSTTVKTTQRNRGLSPQRVTGYSSDGTSDKTPKISINNIADRYWVKFERVTRNGSTYDFIREIEYYILIRYDKHKI